MVLDYNTSILNPLLKVIIFGLLVGLTFALYGAKLVYGGKFKSAFNLLVWMAAVAALTALFRYLGHGTEFGFTKEFSLKWFESLGYIVRGVLFLYAGKKFVDIVETPKKKK